MKWRTLLFLFTCFLMQKVIFGDDEPITVKKGIGSFKFTCTKGNWASDWVEKEITLDNKDEDSGEYKCGVENSDEKTITIRFRTCDNCIEIDAPSLTGIIVGNLVTTFLIGYAVYSIVSQPKGKTFSGNKASDKVNLIPNGDRETYQPLAAGQSSEYSRLGVRKN
ncbi:T-cell surface glycoprotein CD3 delta chain-like [Silurus meridionalis]|uniref:Uncharacterized protein n=1 Tax=Silurus meridionalis TaxID=175797 RepID=A0A8T0B3R9_SILME|nr:T-cell surface glycoprotein CD3 delta chain-like [Silurus meridionalis]XP_046718611.1 T-cell surface glycoprotein CD3 delta chain-like [Silurus meridionalis]KAF7699703.1 hypothetical protein HF521_002661 [Silurus meridionalis]